MARRPSLAILIIVAGSFFLIGLYTAFLGGSPPDPTPVQSTQSQAVVTLEPQQTEKTLLLLGVDNLAASPPSLKSIWLLSFRPPAQDLFLLGIPTDFVTAGDPPTPLDQQFDFALERGPSQSFMEALYRTIPLTIDGIIVLDETGFAQAIDYLGGVSINEATFSGQEVLGIMSLTEDDSSANLSLQRRLLEAMSQQAAEVGASPEITALVNLIPDHLYLSTSINEMVEMMAPMLPIRPETTHFELY